MPRTKLSAAERRTAEHRAFLKLLSGMQRVMQSQTELLTRFMKSYEVTTPPQAYVQSEEREWFNEQQEQADLAKEVAALTPLPNPYMLISTDEG